MKLSDVVTTESVLVALKEYLKTRLKDQKIVSSVKCGLIDNRDELPLIGVLPVREVVNATYNAGLFSIERTFRIDIIDKAYSVDDLKTSLKKKMDNLRALFSTEHLAWNLLDEDGNIQAYDFVLGVETLGEAANLENQYTQFCSLPTTLKSYITVANPVIPTELLEENIPDTLDYLFEQCKGFTHFETFWKEFSKPISLENFPALGIFIQQPEQDKDQITSTQLENSNIIFRVYSSLATREIAFLNHLRNVETVKTWILGNPWLDGRADSFKLFSVDYGIDTFTKPFQGSALTEFPVLRSDISTVLTLMDFKYG
jgi:hypothetical protein